MPSRCCPECFDDRGLRKSIIPSLNPTRGICSFCGSTDVDLVEPGELAEVFEMFISAYELDPQGPDGHFNFPHLWPGKFLRAGRFNYESLDVSRAMRAAASLSR